MTTQVLLDTNAYLRLAKRIQPLLGVEFGQVPYALFILKLVEDEVNRQTRLKVKYPWFDNENFVEERLANRIRLSKAEQRIIEVATSVLQQHVAINASDFTIGGRSPPSRVDCYCLAFGQVRPAIVVTDDIGMHVLAEAFELPIWHGPELLKKLQAAKMINNDNIRETYAALENNRDTTKKWDAAKHSDFKKVFGKKNKKR